MEQEFDRYTLVERPVLAGILASLMLVLLYLGILAIFQSLEHALYQLREMWYWVALLAAGFGIQVALYVYLREVSKLKYIGSAATCSVAAAGGVSTTSMAACCAHHIADIIPILGVSSAAVFLAKFQATFMALGVISNVVGIIFMLKVMKEHGLYHGQSRTLSFFMKHDLNKAFYAAAIAGAVIFTIILSKNLGWLK